MEAVLAERSQEVVELREELRNSQRVNDYFRRLDKDSEKEKDELQAEIKKLKDQRAADEQALLVSFR